MRGEALRTYTTKEAAAAANRTVDAFRGMMTQQRNRGGADWRVPGLDSRTPLWNADAIDAWAAQLNGHAPKPPRPRRLPPQPSWDTACILTGCEGHHTIEEASAHASQLTEAGERLWRSIQATTRE
mgnify:CR=1 FL=1